MIDWTRRSEQKELMDDFTGPVGELATVLQDITRVNRILGGNKITVDAVFKLIGEFQKESYTILDMGCADGNMLRNIALEARKRTIDVKLIGVELSSDAVMLARKASEDFPEISYHIKDILTADFSDFNCDIVTTTLTMHHFNNEGILQFLHQFERLSTIGIVINDLERSKLAYWLFKAFSRLFIRTKTARIDGLISITRSFSRSELEAFAKKLPKLDHRISWKWAFRYVWVMRKQRQNNI
ncbi:methyltransferase domain-containing protein [Maribacter chungangensis]|uniref:Methyltransferase domain-containing protein n=1 Tax=Maribacter chungangensis TaxID=1069117 RepID=A0ABW3B3Z1_9FLAO